MAELSKESTFSKNTIMRLLQKLRHLSFWIFDFLKGSPIQRHYKEVFNTFQNHRNGNLEKNLTKILLHAIYTTKYYKSLPENSNLTDFPVVNKAVIRESFDSFCSDKYKITELIPVVTSGSTGTPFKVFQIGRASCRERV